MLPNGERTEIGEKGINLSGGQKARVSLARAAFSDAEIILLDDPLAAVDAYVGKSILENCLLDGPLKGRTRVLVTHALHVLDKADYIYVMDKGTIIEHGTYDDLMEGSIVFSKLVEEYGSQDQAEDGEGTKKKKEGKEVDEGGDAGKGTQELMQTEERNLGSVEWNVYGRYLKFGGGVIRGPMILIILVLMQVGQGMANFLCRYERY